MKLTAEDRKWSLLIRSRAKWHCERCGRRHEEKSQGLHAAHIFSRRIKKTRHDPENGYALCMGCHLFFHAHPLEFHAWVRQKMGDEKYDALERRARRVARGPENIP